ncbi:hypothetical protein [Cyclobacterium jeungdonense]|uniref:DUF4199 domain-containing protein n=1 Tax=Cyclobacterium jeungdonense TaxID=708087 RepID=A0ABT8C4Z7_9BACT|nr:hypothetical protein [Cyclobacterium jeungdonense]MDN3687452.1 hypothetical protein [Cyclobacterium jeungdonense]
MIKLLQYRAALVTVMFGLFGGAISNFLVIEEYSWIYFGLASILGLTVNLLVSFLLKSRWSKGIKNNIKMVCIFLFTAMVVNLYMHTKFFLERTFAYRDFNNEVTYYVKGTEYTSLAKAFKLANPQIESDADLIMEGFGSPLEKGKVWTEASIIESWLKLISSYALFIIFFVALISILIEVLMGQYGKTTAKSMEIISGKSTDEG